MKYSFPWCGRFALNLLNKLALSLPAYCSDKSEPTIISFQQLDMVCVFADMYFTGKAMKNRCIARYYGTTERLMESMDLDSLNSLSYLIFTLL
jgi:hypothetical protein